MKALVLVSLTVGSALFVSCGAGGGPTAPGPEVSGETISLVRTSQSFPSVSTFEIVLGDVDADGDLDAVVSNMGPHDSRVWLNDGTGRFTDSGQRLMQQGHGVRLADLDADRDLDLVIAGGTWGDGTTWYTVPSRVYLNDGLGRFRDSGQDLGDTALHGNGVEVADVDSDGDLDVHIYYLNSETGGFEHLVYLNDGHGVLTRTDFLLPAGTQVSWADLDRDGDMDVHLREWGVGYRTRLSVRPGVFSDIWSVADPSVVEGSTAFGDLDGDGDLDALVTNGNLTISWPSAVFLNDGSGRFTDTGQRLRAARWASVCLGDLDLDGDLDAYVSIFQLPNEIWLNDGSGNFTDTGLRLGGNAETRSCALGDLDRDGDLDVFVSNYGTGSNEVWLNQTR